MEFVHSNWWWIFTLQIPEIIKLIETWIPEKLEYFIIFKISYFQIQSLT